MFEEKVFMDQAEEIFNEIKAEDVGVWFISDEYGSRIVVKLPSHVIRSIINGCAVDFIFGKDAKAGRKTFFHSAVRVHDSATNPIIISQPYRLQRDYTGLAKIMSEERAAIEFYDETATCPATAEWKISKDNRSDILDLMGDLSDLYLGEYSKDLSLSLDAFDYSIDPSKETPETYAVAIKSIQCQISDLQIVTRTFVGISDVNDVEFSDKDEGGTFEKQIWCSLETLFNYDIYLNPVVRQGSHTRELTDILAFHPLGIFLIETKALGVLGITKEQSIDRKVANVKKQIFKGIKQLTGANKCLSNNWQILSKDGKPIKFSRNIVPHCIILVSELIPFGDWTVVQKEIIRSMNIEKMFLHVFDFLEFMKFIKASKGKREYFDYHLMERSERFIKSRGNIFIKTEFTKTPHSKDRHA